MQSFSFRLKLKNTPKTLSQKAAKIKYSVSFRYNLVEAIKIISRNKTTNMRMAMLILLRVGLSAPELLPTGFSYRIVNTSQAGLNAGIAPSFGETCTSLSLEHSLYFGKNTEKLNQKKWFCRQGNTFFPSAKSSQQFTLNLTVGADVPFRNSKNGITIDAGIFYLPESERSSLILIRSLNLWPALRFEFYFCQ